ncbi:A24 family peptidase [Aeromicrobium alkaliterrae]|uniref:Prepilin type IV endopeptidase peptidase domain-containing protein n=1 Tax=Aeromicrobium alkaliterrae TaxID=302168 RepID=A0ABP4VQ90_9ACTN
MEIVLSAVAAALIGAAGPWVVARVPEPEEADEDKVSYADIARPRWLAPALAAVAALFAGTVAWGTDLPGLLPAWVLVSGVGAWLSYVDIRTRLLPYAIVAPLYLATWLLVGLAALIEQDARLLLQALIANIVVYVIFRVLYEIGRFLGGALGYGDVRLAAVLAVVLGPLGPDATLVGMYAGFLVGAVAGVVLSLARLIDRRSFAFGQYLVLGAVIGAAWGPRLYGS